MPICNLIWNNNYLEISGGLWKYYIDEPFLDANGAIDNFPASNNNISSFKFKEKLTSETVDDKTRCWKNSSIKIFK